MYEPTENLSEALYPRGFRKLMAMTLFFVTATMPAVFAWQNPTPETGYSSPAAGIQPFPSRSGRRFQQQSFSANYSQPSRPTWTWSGMFRSLLQISLATVGGAVSLALYYPRWGFKRFAILCGPLMGFGSFLLLSTYLLARTEVYKVEICLVAIVGALPGLLLYVLLVAWKSNRQTQVVSAELVSPPTW